MAVNVKLPETLVETDSGPAAGVIDEYKSQGACIAALAFA